MGIRSPAMERICAAALLRFAQFGYEATSLSQIAEDVGIRKASIYTHFRSKDALFMEVYAEALCIEKAFVDTCFSQESVEHDPGFLYCGQLFERYGKSPHLRLLLVVGYLPPSHLVEEIDRGYADYLDRLSENYKKNLRRWAQGKGELAETEVTEFMLAYMGIVDSVHVKLVYTNGEEVSGRLKAMQRMLMDALRLLGLE